MLKNLTRLWPGSSSTLTGKKRNKTNPTQEIKQDSTNEAAPGAVGSEVHSGGEGAGQEELEALTVFSQKIQAREKRKTEREKEGAEHKDESKKREEKREQINKKGGGERRW